MIEHSNNRIYEEEVLKITDLNNETKDILYDLKSKDTDIISI